MGTVSRETSWLRASGRFDIQLRLVHRNGRDGSSRYRIWTTRRQYSFAMCWAVLERPCFTWNIRSLSRSGLRHGVLDTFGDHPLFPLGAGDMPVGASSGLGGSHQPPTAHPFPSGLVLTAHVAVSRLDPDGGAVGPAHDRVSTVPVAGLLMTALWPLTVRSGHRSSIAGRRGSPVGH